MLSRVFQCPNTGVLEFECTSESPRRLVKTQKTESHPRVGLKNLLFNRLSRDLILVVQDSLRAITLTKE